jgi:hypothetical protein
MTLAERLSEFVRAAFTGLWVQSFEHDDAIAEIARLCRQQGWGLAAWDIDRGLSLHGRGTDSGMAASASDPLSAIRALGTMSNPEGTSVMVLRSFHRFLNNIEQRRPRARSRGRRPSCSIWTGPWWTASLSTSWPGTRPWPRSASSWRSGPSTAASA